MTGQHLDIVRAAHNDAILLPNVALEGFRHCSQYKLSKTSADTPLSSVCSVSIWILKPTAPFGASSSKISFPMCSSPLIRSSTNSIIFLVFAFKASLAALLFFALRNKIPRAVFYEKCELRTSSSRSL